MDPSALFRRYRELQQYVGWTDENANQVIALAPLLEPHLPAMVDDFYAEIQRHHDTRRIITGGAVQIQRLKATLLAWLRELLSGPYDADYVHRRWRVGRRHVEIGLDQIYANVALSRLRRKLLLTLESVEHGQASARGLAARWSLHTLLDLDLAIIEDAYQAEYLARAQRAERLATIGQVTAGIAHELRNPLDIVKASVHYLLNSHHPAPEKTVEHLRRIERQVTLADGVIAALTAVVERPAPKMAPFSAQECLHEALEICPCPEAIELRENWAPALPPVFADRDQLRIVFANLIRNAQEAMPDGGVVTITGRQAGEGVEVSVTDTGIGMDADQLARLAEPLRSTKEKGLGLGLAIARTILDRNWGTLEVTSALEQGSTFTVRLNSEQVMAAAGSVS
jgi:signal transduction histidine kinase